MTRIASSHPAIWPDICVANRDAIVTALDEYLDVAHAGAGDRRRAATATRCSACSSTARAARRNLPTGLPVDEPLVELRIPVPDRPGVLAEVTTLAAALGRQHRRPRDRALARGPQRCARARRRRAGADAFEAGARRARLPRRRGRRWREHPARRARDRGPGAAARPAARPRRQGHLAPRAAVRGDGRRALAVDRPRRR